MAADFDFRRLMPMPGNGRPIISRAYFTMSALPMGEALRRFRMLFKEPLRLRLPVAMSSVYAMLVC